MDSLRLIKERDIQILFLNLDDTRSLENEAFLCPTESGQKNNIIDCGRRRRC